MTRLGPQSCSEDTEPTRRSVLDEEELLDEPYDSFTKLLAKLRLEIEEEAEIGFEDVLEVAPLNRDNVGDDVQTDHPTSMLRGEEIPVPTTFSNQEVPEDEAEPEPGEAPEITSLPVADDATFEVEGELLYSDIATVSYTHLTLPTKRIV